MEADLLWWIHGAASPALDALFRLSNELGTGPFCSVLVFIAAAVAVIRGQRAEAVLWVVLGISTFALQAGIKEAVGRARPDLWVGPVRVASFAFPSGHAVAAATFYPLLARAVAHRWPHHRRAAYGVAIAVAFYIGFGRLYLGVHWPSDVLAGWAIGAGQTALGMHLCDRWSARSLASAS